MNGLLRLVSLIVISTFLLLPAPPTAHSAESPADRALNLMKQGKPEQAVTLLSTPKAMKDAGLSSIQGWAYLRLNDPDGAEKAFRRSIGLREKQSDAHCGLGYVNLRRGLPVDAMVSFKKGLEQGRMNMDCMAGLAMALEQTGDRTGAKQAAETVLKKDKTNELAQAVLRRLDLTEERPPEDPIRIALDTYRKGEWGAARILLKKIAFDGKMNETVLSALADCHYRLGNVPEAADVYRLMMERGIGTEMARLQLSRIYGIRPGDVQWWQKSSPLTRGRPAKTQFLYRAKGDYFEYFDGKDWKRTYLVGMNIGPAAPGEYPSTAPRDVEAYEVWFDQIAAMESNMIRAYTILPPAFYTALKRHNEKASRPLWLLQEVWLTEREDTVDLYDSRWRDEFREEARRVVDLLHGNAVIPYRPGHAAGIYTADVSPYVFAIGPGREVETSIVLGTNRLHPNKTSYKGRYIEVKNGNPSEVWFAETIDYVASYEMERYNAQRPMTIVNWPPLDPMSHVTEANYAEEMAMRGIPVAATTKDMNDSDAVSLDVMKLNATSTYPAGLFAAFHVYTYWPDFLMYDREYPKTRDDLGSNRYYGYLLDLKKHHRGMPLLVAEYGVPTSWGIAHVHPDGWHNGGFSEKGQAELLDRMTRNIKDSGCAGGLIFAWLDEWWKSVADNFTRPFDQPPERRTFWQNMLNPEENFGIVGYRPNATVPLLRGNDSDWEKATTISADSSPKAGRIRAVRAMSDYAYVYLRIDLDKSRSVIDWKKEAFWVALSTLPGRAGSRELPRPAPRITDGATFLLKIDRPDMATLLIAHGFNPNQWIVDTGVPGGRLILRKKDVKLGVLERSSFEEMMIQANPPRWGRDGSIFPPIFVNRSELPAGTADPALPGSSTLAAWNVDKTGSMIEVRIPWGLLYVADPSTHLFYGGTDGQAEPVFTKGGAIGIAAMHFTVGESGPRFQESLPHSVNNRINHALPAYAWAEWNEMQVKPYMKPAYYSLQRSFRQMLTEMKK